MIWLVLRMKFLLCGWGIGEEIAIACDNGSHHKKLLETRHIANPSLRVGSGASIIYNDCHRIGFGDPKYGASIRVALRNVTMLLLELYTS